MTTRAAASSAARCEVGGDTGDRLPEIADDRITRLLLGVIAELRGLQLAIEDVNRADAGMAFSGGRVDRDHAAMGDGADDAPGVEHPGQLHVERVAGLTGDLLHRIEPRHALANDPQRRVRAERRWLAGRHAPRNLFQSVADDAVGDLLIAQRRLRCGRLIVA